MKNKLIKHETYILPNDSVVVYLPNIASWDSLNSLHKNYEDSGHKVVAWIMMPRNWDSFVEEFYEVWQRLIIKKNGFWKYKNVFVYRGKLKTRIKQFHKEVESEAYTCPHHCETSGYEDCCSCGDWKRGDPNYGRMCDEYEEEIKQEPVMDEETFKKLKPETEAVVNINGTYLVGEPADKFDKHCAETEKVYITGGHLEKPKETTKIFYNPGNSDQDLVHAFLLGMAFVTAILVIANLIA